MTRKPGSSGRRTGMDTFEQVGHDKRPSEPDVESIHAAISREKQDPIEGFKPIPVAFLIALFALLMWGGWYLGEYDAQFDSSRLDGPMAFAVVDSGPQVEVKLDPLVVGKRVYNNCATCHQPDGSGTSTYPPLSNSDWVTGEPRVLVAILLHGIKGPFDVGGTVYNQEMPAWGARLMDGEIAAVASYIRSSWGNSAEPITEEQVAQWRAELPRSVHWSMDELLELRGQ